MAKLIHAEIGYLKMYLKKVEISNVVAGIKEQSHCNPFTS
jgi:hypothetical protein